MKRTINWDNIIPLVWEFIKRAVAIAIFAWIIYAPIEVVLFRNTDHDFSRNLIYIIMDFVENLK